MSWVLAGIVLTMIGAGVLLYSFMSIAKHEDRVMRHTMAQAHPEWDITITQTESGSGWRVR